jgi:hypothetical protein
MEGNPVQHNGKATLVVRVWAKAIADIGRYEEQEKIRVKLRKPSWM